MAEKPKKKKADPKEPQEKEELSDEQLEDASGGIVVIGAKVKEISKSSEGTTSGGWGYQILPYIEQDN